MAPTRYRNIDAIAYAKQYCHAKNNRCSTYLRGDKLSDCANLIALCLAAGGMKIVNKNPEAVLCSDRLAARNADIVATLTHLAGQSENVNVVDFGDTIVGDISFRRVNRPWHSFMVSKTGPLPDKVNALFVRAHSTSRCGEQLDTNFRQWLSSAFRMEDGLAVAAGASPLTTERRS
jgi:hypothetical protein